MGCARIFHRIDMMDDFPRIVVTQKMTRGAE